MHLILFLKKLELYHCFAFRPPAVPLDIAGRRLSPCHGALQLVADFIKVTIKFAKQCVET